MKKRHSQSKIKLHSRSRHRGQYDFDQLILTSPDLAPFVQLNTYNNFSINFFDPDAVKALNKALLQHHYGIKNWDIPPNYLCPPIPGRADYIHYVADLLAYSDKKAGTKAKNIKCLDIGTGANCIYPLIGTKEYGWSFVGSEIDPIAISSANKIIDANPALAEKIDLRLQPDKNKFFEGIIQTDEYFDLSFCNPPFYASVAEAKAATLKKLSNLKGKTIRKPTRNFGGQNNEIWYPGGEEQFVKRMILESQQFMNNCGWFTSLVSKQSTLVPSYKILEKTDAVKIKTIPMGQGNKFSRILAWTFQPVS